MSSMPLTDSIGVQRCLDWTPQRAPLAPRPPYANGGPSYTRPSHGLNHFGSGGVAYRNRPISAPLGRAHSITSIPEKAPLRTLDSRFGQIRETPVTQVAPFAPRLSSAHHGSLHERHYCSLNDPHLYDYFVRKFMTMDPLLPSGGRRGRRPDSAPVRRTTGKRKKKKDSKYSDFTYKVAVTTGNKKNASTDAHVYISIKGTKGKLSRRQLAKKPPKNAPIKRRQPFLFTKGSTHIFKFTEKDIGDINSVVIEHDGVTEEEGWYLEEIHITKVDNLTGRQKSWLFICKNWLSLHEGDCVTRRELFSISGSKTEYEVVVVTGNVKGAGTDAVVFLTLFGKTGQTPKLQLRNSAAANPFERGQSDVFVLKTNCVGPMTKLRIEHDNTGMAPGWFLDRIVVTDLKNPRWKFYFPCGAWLAKDEGDGQICRDLVGSQDPLAVRKSNQYKVTVYTGDKRGAGTDANVFVTLFGDVGESLEKRLDTKGKNDFERGSVDTFILESPSVGTLKRIRISHDNSGASPGWFLDKVIVDDLEQNRVYEFKCARWLARDEDDGQISRDLVCGVDSTDAPPGVPYTIHVKTGDVANAGTSAGVYMVMHGGKTGEKTSGKIWLNDGRFERGRTDIFNVEVAESLSPLSRIDIGHDNKGAAAGWFLEEVVVNCPSAGIEQTFKCGKWFAKDEGDKLIERTLFETSRKERDKTNTWFIWVRTADDRGAGTDANVYLVVYGKNKRGESLKTDEILLDNKGDNFEKGQEDKFKVEMAKIGKPYKLRVWHDDSKPFAAWKLDQIEMENMATKKRYLFRCNRWLGSNEDDGESVREIPAEGEDIRHPESLVKYAVSVHTGKKMGAGTDADVFLNIFGEQGDTGERPLHKSQNRNKFEKGNVDEFTIEAVSLKQLHKIRIGHNGKRAGSGWFLDKVVVRPLDGHEKETVFECNRWLDTKEDDGLIVREITADGSELLNTTSYHVSVKTGSERNAGTDANVYLKIFGAEGDTGTLQLKSSENNTNKFEKGRTDLFKLEATDIGKIKKIRIGHDGAGPGSGWFLDEVRIDVPSIGENYVFACHRWLDKKEADGQLEVELEPTNVEKGSAKIPYEITVWTGDKKGAGTDANVFIQMYGEGGKTEEYFLRNKTDNFEQGQVDKFKIEAADVGPLLKIRVGHDGKGSFDGWFLDKILIRRHPGRDSKRRKDWKRRSSSLQDRLRGRRLDDDDDDSSSGGLSVRGHRRKRDIVRRSSTVGSHRRNDDDDDDDDDHLSRRRSSLFGDRRKKDDGYSSLDRRSDSRNRRESVRADSPLGRRSSPLRRGRLHSDDDDDDVRGHGRHRNRHDDDRNSRTGRYEESDRGGRRRTSRDRHSDEERHSNTGRRLSRGRYDDDDKDSLRRHRLNHDDRRRLSKGRYDDSDDDTHSSRDRRTSRGRHEDEDRHRDRHTGTLRRSSRGRHSDDDDVVIGSRRSGSRLSRHDDDDDRNSSLRRRSLLRDDHDGRSSRLSATRRSSRFDDDDDDVKHRPRSAALRRSPLRRSNSSSDSDSRSSRRPGSRTGHSKDRRDSPSRRRHDDSDSDSRRSKRRGSTSRFRRSSGSDSEGEKRDRSKEEVEEYWFVCQRWFARNEDDKKIVRELLPTTEDGKKLENGLEEVEYIVHVFTGDKRGAGTDANVFIKITGELGDTGDRQLKDSKNLNKFERNQEDIFKVSAVELGKIRKVKIRHDNKGGGSAWFLDHIEIEDPISKTRYYFACQRWLATDEDDGQIARELVPVDSGRAAGKGKNMREDTMLENKAQMTTYHVYVYTGDKFGAGTDANVFIMLFGEVDDTGIINLKASKNNRNKFERNQMDEFVIEAVDIGEIKKIRIGHDNAGGGGAWYLDRVEIDSPSLGKKWFFPHSRWLGKDKDDGKLERDLFPQDMATEEYNPCIPYEITTYTSDISGAGTDADVYVVLYGENSATEKKSLCQSKAERKQAFNRRSVSKFVVELDDVGELVKLRIGHDGKGFGAGWHLDKVEVRCLKSAGKGSDTYVFPCKRWLARDEDDGSIERELLPEQMFEDVVRSDGSIKRRDLGKRTTLTKKNYTVNVITGNESGAGTDANVFINIFGDRSDCGERQLKKSETHRNKFEKGQTDRFVVEAVDLGKLYKIKIRHDNSNFSPGWFLDRVEIIDPEGNETYTFHCERWLAKNKDDGKIERSIYSKGYQGDVSTSTLHSAAGGASVQSLDSSEPFSGRSPRLSRRHTLSLENIPEGPAVSYTVKISTGNKNDAGTDSAAWINIYGPEKRSTGRQYLNLTSGKGFKPGSIEVFTLEALDVEEVQRIELGHDGVTEGSGWFVENVEIDVPTKGHKYFFMCREWLAVDKSDGKTSRTFVLSQGDSSVINYRPLIPYEVTFQTGDVKDAGTDSRVFIKIFGQKGSSTEIYIDKMSERFERGRTDLIKMEMEDVGPLLKLRVGHDGKGNRNDWFLSRVEVRNMTTGDLAVFEVDSWLSKTKEDRLCVRDFPAKIRGKHSLKYSNYIISVKTSDVFGAGTDAGVFLVLFGESGDSGELHLNRSSSNKKPFERNQTDIFTFKLLQLGHLIKARVWHDNKGGLGTAWHLDHIQVEEENTGHKFLFPCSKWLSTSDDDRQTCRELSCANQPESPRSSREKILYQVDIKTTDMEDAGVTHDVWIVLEGEERRTKEFLIENTSRNKLFRRGQLDSFGVPSRELGEVRRVVIGCVERRDGRGSAGSARRGAGKDLTWHCKEVIVTNQTTGDRYVFPCNDWIQARRDVSLRHGTVLEIGTVDRSQFSAQKGLGTVKYDVSTVTGNEFGSGTNANVFVTLYGETGDTGKRQLTKKGRDLFERNRTDTFQIEAIDLGELKKVQIEHDNSGFRPGWLLDRVEVTNQASNRIWIFPCNKWLDKKKADGLTSRELFPRD